ncbi:GntR family transcriptional regulator [Alicyclobacillus dauci]|uniref:GntR family transcriptional regulator n=1 Tax=Alicyclobacillus dauci TaxID=1475485 RepID=A0ABY6Z1B9_9BACL|nr:GntR family transcriptional regulator [Alicyclobacillus dauci]WAH36318.1 GntR family transcriptional regulator [Alicyclobacillus dauci]
MSRYLDIRQEILTRILSGEWPHGALLPSENTLAQEYGVTRVTIRQALAALEQERFLTTHQGVGRYVNQREDQVVSVLSRLESMDNLMSIKSEKVVKQLIEYVPIVLSEYEASRLQVSNDAPGRRLVRIRYAGGLPAAVSVNIFPEFSAPDEAATGSLLQTLDMAGHLVDYAETEIIVPKNDDPYVGALQNGNMDTPILVLRQLHRDRKHVPIFLAHDYLNMNVFSLQVTRHRLEATRN